METWVFILLPSSLLKRFPLNTHTHTHTHKITQRFSLYPLAWAAWKFSGRRGDLSAGSREAPSLVWQPVDCVRGGSLAVIYCWSICDTLAESVCAWGRVGEVG
jgi:hypothetical protein